MRRIVLELRLPVTLGSEAIRERAQALSGSGFRWDASHPPFLQPGDRDEIGTDNPTDRTIKLWGWASDQSIATLEAEPDVVSVHIEDGP